MDLDRLREDETVVSLLSEEERRYFERFHYPKRRLEWLGGRIAAKIALLSLLDAEDFRRQTQWLTILPDKYGKPTVSGRAAKKELSLSISHSGKYAVALTVQGISCGIDLQEISDKLPSLTDYFASRTELELLTGLPEIGSYETSLTMLWAVKEAVKKSVLADQPTSFSGIAVEKVAAIKTGAWQFSCSVQNCAPQTAFTFDSTPYILAATGGNRLTFHRKLS
ncbi:hypothetical protein VU07_01615 [Desulfobulbus sp. F4]|nr:hypothetical protein [Desulfobulbus sp. F4]